MGWKCPCCDTVSPTAAAAQKHVETHSNVRAFRCSVCGYRGNTLRGMRTHVRIHFDRRNADLCEDNYITCIMGATGVADFTNLPAAAAAAAAAAGMMPSSPPDMDQILKSLGIPADICAKVLSSAAANQGQPPSEDGTASSASARAAAVAAAAGGGGGGASSLAGLQFLQLAQRMVNHSPGPTTGAGCRSDKLFLCDLCCYSSSYRGNVIRHSKLVHGREISDVAVVSSNFLQQAVTGGKAMPPSASDAAHVKLLLSAAAEQQQQQSAASAAAAAVVAATAANSPTGEETIQVKIDPEDFLLNRSTNSSSQSSHHSPPVGRIQQQQPAAVAADPFRKHCKSCNITFTYMNTFLAHKKYYCSSHAPLGGVDSDAVIDDEIEEDEEEEEVIDDRAISSESSSSPRRPASRQAHHSEATPT